MPRAARATALRMLDLQLRQQAMVLSFERLFYICGIAFLCVLPLVFLLRCADTAAEKVERPYGDVMAMHA